MSGDAARNCREFAAKFACCPVRRRGQASRFDVTPALAAAIQRAAASSFSARGGNRIP
jgi:hypothetical protein